MTDENWIVGQPSTRLSSSQAAAAKNQWPDSRTFEPLNPEPLNQKLYQI